MATASTATNGTSVYTPSTKDNQPRTPASVNNGVRNGLSSGSKSNGNKESIPKSLNHVNFGSEDTDIQDRKKKYLTAKYGQHQMNLIKKRLRVEMWMYEQLALLYDTNVSVN